MTVIHTEIHCISAEEIITTAIQENDHVTLRHYESPLDFANNNYSELTVPYTFLEEILRVRKHLACPKK